MVNFMLRLFYHNKKKNSKLKTLQWLEQENVTSYNIPNILITAKITAINNMNGTLHSKEHRRATATCNLTNESQT